MEISNNSINQPVNFYNKNTENNINMAIDNDNHAYTSNIFAPEFGKKTVQKNVTIPLRKKRRNKRLNTIDSDYLPDEASSGNNTINSQENNFFIDNKKDSILIRFKKAINHFTISTPIINYFFLKQKKQNIQKAVESLNNINQNVDELLNSAIPFGEEASLYQDIAKNLNNAANIIGKVEI